MPAYPIPTRRRLTASGDGAEEETAFNQGFAADRFSNFPPEFDILALRRTHYTWRSLFQ